MTFEILTMDSQFEIVFYLNSYYYNHKRKGGTCTKID